MILNFNYRIKRRREREDEGPIDMELMKALGLRGAKVKPETPQHANHGID